MPARRSPTIAASTGAGSARTTPPRVLLRRVQGEGVRGGVLGRARAEPRPPARRRPVPRIRLGGTPRRARTRRRRAGPCWTWGHSSGPRSNCRSRTPEFVGRAGGRTGEVVGPVDPGRPQMGQRHAVRPAHRGVAAGQRDVREVPEPGEAGRSPRAGTPRPTRRRRRRGPCRRRRRRSPAGCRPARARPSRRRRARDGAGRVRRAGAPRSGRPTGRSGSRDAGRTPGSRAVRPVMDSNCRRRVLEGPLRADVVHVADVRRQPGLAARRPDRRRSSGLRRRRGPAARAAGGRPAAGRSHGSGGSPAAPRRRRGPRSRRTGTWIGRSCVSQASARCASRSSASVSSVTIGSPDRLPLVMTSSRGPSGSPGRPSSRWCRGVYGSITPRSGLPGATASAGRGSRPRTTGADAASSGRPAGPGLRAGSVPRGSAGRGARRRPRVLAMTANGLSPRALRRRRRATAASFVASQARW